MFKISIICVGSLKEKYLRDAIDEYSKRLKTLCEFNIIEIDEQRLPDSPSQAQIDTALQKEGEQILKKIKSGAKVVAMCIEGNMMTSPAVAEMISSYAVRGASEIAFIIGGSFGLSDEVKQKADFKLSMSPMTFPHQLARVMLTEQIYRAFMINRGSKYHK
ncbi:MAG: 23S rRNA (pseudouridine(1915)-N(3))-methyltransferase RlmH [Acutalibacteraceae bacterium]